MDQCPRVKISLSLAGIETSWCNNKQFCIHQSWVHLILVLMDCFFGLRMMMQMEGDHERVKNQKVVILHLLHLWKSYLLCWEGNVKSHPR